MRVPVLLVAAVLAGGVAAVPVITASTAYAGSCDRTVTISGPQGSALTLTPSPATVTLGGCVGFDNETSSDVTITVAGSSFTATVQAHTTEGSYTPSRAGTTTLTAAQSLLGIRTAAGTDKVVTRAAASPSPSHGQSSSPTPTHGHGHGSPSASPILAPTPTASTSGGSHHHAGAASSSSPVATVSLPPLPALPGAGAGTQPPGADPLVAPGATPSSVPTTPVAAGASSSPVALSGPIEPVDDRDVGLPAAVAAVVALGVAGGLGRVALAGRAVDGPARRRRPSRRLRRRGRPRQR